MTLRRSHRSTNAPDTNANMSQGSRPATATTLTRTGSRVNVAASNGIATHDIPSPRFEIVDAVQTRANGLPRRSLTRESLPGTITRRESRPAQVLRDALGVSPRLPQVGGDLAGITNHAVPSRPSADASDVPVEEFIRLRVL